MKTLTEIQNEVREWSKANFNDTPTKLPKMYGMGQHEVRLGSLAPLLGITEEIGELHETRSNADRCDALGDAMIYLCDFAASEDVPLLDSTVRVLAETHSNYQHFFEGVMVSLGRLNHAVLKHHQGIRGLGDPPTYRKEIDSICQVLMAELWKVSREYIDLARWPASLEMAGLQILNDTWSNVVSKRDWKTDPKEGGGHKHAQPLEDLR